MPRYETGHRSEARQSPKTPADKPGAPENRCVTGLGGKTGTASVR